MHRTIVAFSTAFLLAACANPINQRTAQTYYAVGERALTAGDLPLAKQSFSRALINARIGNLGPAAESQAAMKLGQVLGNLCEYEEAGRAFLDAFKADEVAYGSGSWQSFPAYVAIAQLDFDIGRYKQAATYYERAFAVGGTRLERADPISYSRLLDDYAVALGQSGSPALAAAAKSKANGLRATAKGPGPGIVQSSVDYVPYPKSCKSP